MPQPHRTRTLRRIKTRLPGGALVIHYEKRKKKIDHCAVCKKPLSGIPRVRAYKLHSLPKSKKRPERSSGGTLCSKCSREKLKEKRRSLKGYLKQEGL